MPKYMINIFYGDEQLQKQQAKKYDGAFIVNKYMEWSEKLKGKTVFAYKLKDGEGRKVEFVNGKFKDGPYTETKESIGGFYIIEAKNYDEATKIAHDCPTLLYSGGYVEVREVEF